MRPGSIASRKLTPGVPFMAGCAGTDHLREEFLLATLMILPCSLRQAAREFMERLVAFHEGFGTAFTSAFLSADVISWLAAAMAFIYCTSKRRNFVGGSGPTFRGSPCSASAGWLKTSASSAGMKMHARVKSLRSLEYPDKIMHAKYMTRPHTNQPHKQRN